MCGSFVSVKKLTLLLLALSLAAPVRAQDGFEAIGEDPMLPSGGMKLVDPLSVPDDVNPSIKPGKKAASKAAQASDQTSDQTSDQGADAKSFEEEFAPPTDEPQMSRNPLVPKAAAPQTAPETAPEATPAPAPSRPARPAARPSSNATKKAPAKSTKSYRGLVIAEEGGTVFQEPNFDSATLGMVSPGQNFEISSGKRNGFYRIRLKPGTLGWISDAEIKPLGVRETKPTNTKAPGKPKKEAPKKKAFKPKPINNTRYVGPLFSSVNYLEDTMGARRKESLSMFGLRWSGPNTVMSGDINIDSEILVKTSPPNFYRQATGNPATGFMLIGDFVFVTDIPQSRSLMAYYGFGPMFRFSQYNVLLNMDGGKTRNYNLTDITLGAVFALGVATALGDHYAVRLDGRYYWETQRYTSVSLALQMDF